MSTTRRAQQTLPPPTHPALRHVYETPSLTDRHLASSSSSPMPPTPAGPSSGPQQSAAVQFMQAQIDAGSLNKGAAPSLLKKPMVVVPVLSKASAPGATSTSNGAGRPRKSGGSKGKGQQHLTQQVQETLRKAGLSSEQYNAMKEQILATFSADQSFLRAQKERDAREGYGSGTDSASEATAGRKTGSSATAGNRPNASDVERVTAAAAAAQRQQNQQAAALRRVASNPSSIASTSAAMTTSTSATSAPQYRNGILVQRPHSLLHQRETSNASLRSTPSSSASEFSPDPSLGGRGLKVKPSLEDIAERNASGRRERRESKRSNNGSVGEQRTPKDARDLAARWTSVQPDDVVMEQESEHDFDEGQGAGGVGLGLGYDTFAQAQAAQHHQQAHLQNVQSSLAGYAPTNDVFGDGGPIDPREHSFRQERAEHQEEAFQHQPAAQYHDDYHHQLPAQSHQRYAISEPEVVVEEPRQPAPSVQTTLTQWWDGRAQPQKPTSKSSLAELAHGGLARKIDWPMQQDALRAAQAWNQDQGRDVFGSAPMPERSASAPHHLELVLPAHSAPVSSAPLSATYPSATVWQHQTQTQEDIPVLPSHSPNKRKIAPTDADGRESSVLSDRDPARGRIAKRSALSVEQDGQAGSRQPSPCPSFVSVHLPLDRNDSVSPAPMVLDPWPLEGSSSHQSSAPESRASSVPTTDGGLAPPSSADRYASSMIGSSPMPVASGSRLQSSPAPSVLSSGGPHMGGLTRAGSTNSIMSSTGKPSYSYAAMIGQAILSAPQKKICLNDIYSFIMHNYPFYKKEDAGWQNSIRHNLSLNESFIKVARGPNEPGKGHFWAIAEGAEDQFANGGFKKRPGAGSGSAAATRRRSTKAGKGKGKGKQQDDDASSTADASSSPARFIETSPVKQNDRGSHAADSQRALRSEGDLPVEPFSRRLAPPSNSTRFISSASIDDEDEVSESQSPDPSPLVTHRTLPVFTQNPEPSPRVAAEPTLVPTPAQPQPPAPEPEAQVEQEAVPAPEPQREPETAPAPPPATWFASPPSKVLAKLRGPYQPLSNKPLTYDEDQQQRKAVLMSSPAFEDCGIVHRGVGEGKLGAPMIERERSLGDESSEDGEDTKGSIFASERQYRLPHLPGLINSMSPISNLRGSTFTSPIQRVRTFSATSNVRGGGQNDSSDEHDRRESLTLPPLNLQGVPKTPEGAEPRKADRSPRKDIKLTSIGPLKEALGRDIFSTPMQGSSSQKGLFFGTPAGRFANNSPGYYDDHWLDGAPSDPYDTSVQVSEELERLSRAKQRDASKGADAKSKVFQTPGMDSSIARFPYSPWS